MLETVTGTLPAATALAVRALATAAAATDGVEPLGEQTLLDLATPGVVHVLLRDGDALVGYGHLGPAPSPSPPTPGAHAAPPGVLGPGPRPAELVVASASRGAGLGRRILAALLDAASPGTLAVWAHGSLPAALRLAHGAGLVPARELWRMELPLVGTVAGVGPGPLLPPGVTVRPYAAGDEVAWLAANAAAFAHHPEQGRMTRVDLRARMAEPWFRPEDLLLAESDGTLVGYAWLKVEPPIGELYVLGVVPRAQGSGLGRALTAVALDRLSTPGDGRAVERAVLFVDADNAAAVRTYTAAGFRVVRRDTQLAPPAP